MTDTLVVWAVDGKWPERSEEKEFGTYTEVRTRGCQTCPGHFTFQTNVFLFCRGDGGKEGCYTRTDANRRNSKSQTSLLIRWVKMGLKEEWEMRNSFFVNIFGHCSFTKEKLELFIISFASWCQAWSFREFVSALKFNMASNLISVYHWMRNSSKINSVNSRYFAKRLCFKEEWKLYTFRVTWGCVNKDMTETVTDGHDLGQKSEHVAWLQRWNISKTKACIFWSKQTLFKCFDDDPGELLLRFSLSGIPEKERKEYDNG